MTHDVVVVWEVVVSCSWCGPPRSGGLFSTREAAELCCRDETVIASGYGGSARVVERHVKGSYSSPPYAAPQNKREQAVLNSTKQQERKENNNA